MRNKQTIYYTLGLMFLVLTTLLAKGEKPLNIKFALKYGMIKEELSVLDKFKLVQELGYDGLEVNAPSKAREGFKAAMDTSGLPIHGVVCSTHWKKPLSDPDEKIRAEGLEGLKQALRDAAYYGANTVLLVPGKVSPEVSYEEAWQRSIVQIRKALPLAEKLNIQIILENVWNNFLTTPEETFRYINELNHPLIGAYFDVGNTVRYNEPASWPSVLKSKIIKLDVKEYKRQPEGGNVWHGFGAKIGSGDNDWPAVCRELKNINYDGWATAEVGGGKRERLKEILSNMKRALSY